MGFGDTAKKITTLTAKAEKIYSIAKDLHEKLTALKEEIEEMRDSMKTMDAEMEQQRKEIQNQRRIITAIAAEHDIDVDELLAESEQPPENAEGEHAHGEPTPVDTADVTPPSSDDPAREESTETGTPTDTDADSDTNSEFTFKDE